MELTQIRDVITISWRYSSSANRVLSGPPNVCVLVTGGQVLVQHIEKNLLEII